MSTTPEPGRHTHLNLADSSEASDASGGAPQEEQPEQPAPSERPEQGEAHAGHAHGAVRSPQPGGGDPDASHSGR